MSKHSPSIAGAGPLRRRRANLRGRRWVTRLFHNTYTRKGRRMSVRAWAIKLQFQGRRRTISLSATTKREAAVEARRIYWEVRTEGWEAMLRSHARAVENKLRLRPEEVTLAFHWSSDPYLCTYTTVRTSSGTAVQTAKPVVKTNRTCGVCVAEPEMGLQASLNQWLDSHPGFTSLPGKEEEGVSLSRAELVPCLWLVNRDVAERFGLGTADRFTTLANGMPALPYSVYPNSDELFRLSPGRRSSYLFKRLGPQKMLEPIAEALRGGTNEFEALEQHARSFFQSLVESRPMGAAATATGVLTQRERDVLALVSRGCVDKEIARVLGISSWTVHEHVKRVFEKLKVHSRIEAALAYLHK